VGREGFARRRIRGKVLDHTYTRVTRSTVVDDPSTPTEDESHDWWGAEVTTHTVSNTVPDVPCSYTERERLIRTADGMLLVNTPALKIEYTDPLDVGDWVSDVRDEDELLLMAGPAVVEEITPIAPSGPVVMRIALVRQVRVTE
jgi:hypothetical protein